MTRLGRRAVLAGLAAGLAAPALRARAAAPESLAAILERSGLGGVCGFAVADLDGGLIEGHRAEAALPPASTVKIFTALYALDALGSGFRFDTRLVATGPVEAGVVRGDLVLAGAGDPLLDTDALGDLAQALAAAGVRGVAGRFLVADGALPAIAEIDASQPEDAGYNPAISGMNLNFNRVELSWQPGEGGPRWRFGAPGARFDPDVAGVGARLAAGAWPTHRFEGGGEVWLLPPDALRGRGSVWLPVRAPGLYAGEVFGRLAADAGIVLPAAEVAAAPPGVALAGHRSQAARAMMGGMLHHSTNLTAEVAGLRAGRARGAGARTLAGSAEAMAAWARTRYGLGPVAFVNHSGLTDASRMSPAAMVRVLAAERDGLPALLRERPVVDAGRRPVEGLRMLAKTGTLYFASALAGYLEGPGGRRLGFAIFAADMELRARVPPRYPDEPAGAKAWAARARAQEQALLRRWAALYG
jgi:D-alanyl-D-alanine carboxypeptidase/D-alanyl-D-alanine-endopeptidase (penicillin-binding protein 4)